QSAAYLAATGSTASTTGAGHGPLATVPPARSRASCRWQVRRGMPIRVQNLKDRHRRVLADHLEVLEGARRSADFFHTRSSTVASPKAALSSSTSASSSAS